MYFLNFLNCNICHWDLRICLQNRFSSKKDMQRLQQYSMLKEGKL